MSSQSDSSPPQNRDPHSHDDHSHDDHSHGDHEHGDHEHASGILGWVQSIFHQHSHDHTDLATDQAFQNSDEGIRTVWLALAALLATTLLQVVIFVASGSVALLADTVHNLGDMLNSIPLLIAFYLARRVATRRYNYGFSRAEDVAGIFIVFSIAFSAGYIFWESYQKLVDPEPLRQPLWVAVAAIIGFLGNEAVALLQIRKGREIGSAALVADGLHARTDGLTSLAVLLAVVGYWFNMPIVDPLVGMAIGIAILFITKDATVSMWYRLMDAIEPEMVDKAEEAAEGDGIREVRRVRMRWLGHKLHAEVHIAVDAELSTARSHAVAEDARHRLFHQIPRLSEALVHVEPWNANGDEFHAETDHHEPMPTRLQS